MARFCICGCGESLELKRSNAVYFSDACRKRYERSLENMPPEPEQVWPRQITERIRENYCSRHAQTYSQTWLDDPFRIWSGDCSICNFETQMKPAVEAEFEKRRPDFRARVRADLEAREPELGPLVEQEIARLTVAVRMGAPESQRDALMLSYETALSGGIADAMRERLAVGVREQIEAAMKEEIFQEFLAARPKSFDEQLAEAREQQATA